MAQACATLILSVHRASPQGSMLSTSTTQPPPCRSLNARRPRASWSATTARSKAAPLRPGPAPPLVIVTLTHGRCQVAHLPQVNAEVGHSHGSPAEDGGE